ncbi:hypothetical protein DICA0_E10000 [Diutina catenulata]
MRIELLTLTLLPSAFAAEWIKLWKRESKGLFGSTRCYATVDDNFGCNKICDWDGRHVSFDNKDWTDSAKFGRFTDPRANTDTWLNIWPDPDSDKKWGVYYEGEEGKKVGECEIVDDKQCSCGNGVSVRSLAYCRMYQ